MKKQHLHRFLSYLLAALLAAIMLWYHHIYVNWNPSLFPVAVALSVLVFLALAITVIWPGDGRPLKKCLLIFGWFAAFVGVQQGVGYLINNHLDKENVLAMRTVLLLLAVLVIALLIKPFRALDRKGKILTSGAALLLILTTAAATLWIELQPRPSGQALDMSKFELTWSDEFDGDSLDRTKWDGSYMDENGLKQWTEEGYAALGTEDIRDGMLHITVTWLEEGMNGGPAGWYGLGIDTRNTFRQKFGYFEMRCKLPKGQGMCAAFWMMPDAFGDTPEDGRTGAEIDIFENPYYWNTWPRRNSVSSAIHYGGYDGGLQSQGVARSYVHRPYDTFHTYGVEWNENEYIFYIDGVETGRSSFGGVCQNELWLLLSVGGGYSGWDGDIRKNKPGVITDWAVDYVRAYQYKELL